MELKKICLTGGNLKREKNNFSPLCKLRILMIGRLK